MAIPQTALIVNFNPDNVTLDELCLFEEGGFTAWGFRKFLIDHTNWTAIEIGALTVSELKDVTSQLGEKLKESAVPLVSP